MRSILVATILALCAWAVFVQRLAPAADGPSGRAPGAVDQPGAARPEAAERPLSAPPASETAPETAPESASELAESPPAASASTDGGLEQELGDFLQLLAALRSGESAGPRSPAGAELRAAIERAAEDLCLHQQRCEARAIAAYFLSLDEQALRIGWQDWQDYAELHARAYTIFWGEEDPLESTAGGAFELEQLRADLNAFVETGQERADVTPLAYAYALRAQLRAADVGPRVPSSELERDDLAAAAEDARRSIATFARTGLVKPSLDPRALLGELEARLLHPEESRNALETCARLAASIDSEDFLETSLFGLVQLGHDLGDVALIESSLREVAAFRDAGNCWPLAREYATLLLHADRPEGALRFLLRHPPQVPGVQNEWHMLLAAIFLRCGDPASAQREIDALELAEDDELLTLARARLGLALGETDELLERLEVGGAWEDWSLEGQAQAYVAIGEAWLAREAPERALPWLQDALELSSDWRAKQEESPERRVLGGSVTGEWLGMQAVVQLASAQAALGEALEAARVLEGHQARRLRPDEHGLPRDVSRAELLSWAANYELGLVSWGIGADDGLVAHVAADGQAWAGKIEHGRRAMQEATRRLREAIQDDDRPRTSALAREIGAALFPPALRERLARAAAGDDQRRVLLLLHGPLESLPVALLELEGQTLDQRLVPVVLPGLPSFDAALPTPTRFERGAGWRWSLLGDPRDSRAGVLLPGAERELAALAATYPDAVLRTGEAFDREALHAALTGTNPVHIATHLLESPGCGGARLAPAGLLLSHSDILCSDEILAWRPRLPLVALTACETAGGRFIDAEGLHGLSRAFLESGTRNLLVTLWPIEDRAAERFALLFHQELLLGALPSRALRDARTALAREGWPASAWAAFRFLGRD